MSQEYEEIMQIRRDISAYLLHCTRRKEEGSGTLEAFEVLTKILCDGFLKATLAFRKTSSGRDIPNVKGPKRAVCFTEQPLKFFLETVKVSKSYRKERYTEFAVAIRKGDLFEYGGRPVIYTDEKVLGEKLSPEECVNRNYPSEAWVYKDRLPLDLQYLFVNYDPNAILDSIREYRPIDFTHEREWRACPNTHINNLLYLFGQEEIAVPLQLPTINPSGSGFTIFHPTDPRFAILVDTEQSKRELRCWIARTVDQISERGAYWENYAKALQKAPILSFEKINDTEINGTKDELTRLEDFINDDFTLKDFLYPAGF